MRVNANAVLRSWTLLADFGGSYAPDIIHTHVYTNIHVDVHGFICTCTCMCIPYFYGLQITVAIGI